MAKKMSVLFQVQDAADGLTASELAKSLKSAAQKAEALASREAKMKGEIEAKKKEIESLQKKLEEFGDLKKLASRLREERDKLSKRLKEKEDDQTEIIELKKKNCKLECEKMKAKTDADVYEKRFKELEGRLLIKNLEKVESVKLTTAKTITGKRKVCEETSDSSSDSDDGSEYSDDSSSSSSSDV